MIAEVGYRRKISHLTSRDRPQAKHKHIKCGALRLFIQEVHMNSHVMGLIPSISLYAHADTAKSEKYHKSKPTDAPR